MSPYRRAKKAPRKRTYRRKPQAKRIRTMVAREVKKNHPTQYYDISVDYALATGNYGVNLLQFLMQNSGILDSYPQPNEQRRNVLLLNGTNLLNEYRKINFLGFSYRFIVSNPDTAGGVLEDPNNIVRLWANHTSRSYLSGQANYATDIYAFLDTRQSEKTIMDRTIMLNAIQQTTGGNNIIPMKKFIKGYCRVGKTFRCISDSNGTNWDTKNGCLWLNMCSDSTLSPHPLLQGVLRVYYKILD